MNHCRRQTIALIKSDALQPRFKYFLTYGANDLYWPEIPKMVGQLIARNEKAVVPKSCAIAGALGTSVAVDDPVDIDGDLGGEDDVYEDEEDDRSFTALVNPSDALKLKVPDLKEALRQRGEDTFPPGQDKLDLYFRLCTACGFCLNAQTYALGMSDLRILLRKHGLRSTGTKSELQKRLTLKLRPDLPQTVMPKSERERIIAENPLISTVHYYDREAALWAHVLNGKYRPLDNIGSYVRRHDQLQRGSFHTHSMVGSTPKPNEVNDEDATFDDVCDGFARVASAEHGNRVPNYDEYGNMLDVDQEAYLADIENGRVPTAEPAAGVPAVLLHDAQRRPKIPYALHPGHKRTPLVSMNHPAYKAHARANRSAYQFHRCMKVCYKYDKICRFRYPRQLHVGKARFCRRGGNGDGRKRVYIELKRDHPWLNPTQEVIQNTWCSNVDIQRVVDEPGSVAYMMAAAYYTTATTKPENDVLTKRLKASLARLGPTSTVAQRMTKVANVMMNTLQIPMQAQIATLLGQKQCPIVDNSHKCIDVIVVPRGMQAQVVDVEAVARDDGEDFVTVSSKRKLVECYMQRNTCTAPCPLSVARTFEKRTWSSLCFHEFASNFFLTKSKIEKNYFAMGDYRVAQHVQPVAIAPIPHISTDESDEQNAYGTLFLWHPFQEERELYVIPAHDELPDVQTTAVEVLAYLKQAGLLSGKAQQSRHQEVMAQAARVAFGADGNGDNFDREDDPCAEGAQEGEYDEYGDDGNSSILPPWTHTQTTGAGTQCANIQVLAPLQYLELRNYIAAAETTAKEARADALKVFDRNLGSFQGGNDFGEASSTDCPAFTAKEMELQKTVEKLSAEQLDAYECVAHYTEPGSKAGQLIMMLAGAAGVGKSKLLKAIVLKLRLQYGSKSTDVVAQTNCAAKLVDGHTVDSTFPSIITRQTSDEKELKMQATAIQSFRDHFFSVKLLIHEEHSLTNSETIYHMHCCFCKAFPEKKTLPFAGFNVNDVVETINKTKKQCE